MAFFVASIQAGSISAQIFKGAFSMKFRAIRSNRTHLEYGLAA